MDNELLNKLKEILSQLGVDGEKADEIVSEVEANTTNDGEPTPAEPVSDAPVDENTVPTPDAEPSGEPVNESPLPPVDEAKDDETVNHSLDELKPADDPAPVDDANPVVDPNEVNPADLIPSDETPAPTEPTAPEVPQVPQVDVELQGKVEEQAKTIDGLLSRIDALENALKQSGIMSVEGEGNKGTMGIDESKVPANEPMDDPMTSVLAKINGHR